MPPPFHICVLGDFTGRAGRGSHHPETLAKRAPVPADRDNLDDLPAKLGVEIELAMLEGAPVRLAIGEPDHFRPEWLVDRLDAFAELRALRRRLADPSRFAAAAAEMGEWAAFAEPAAPAPEPPKEDPAGPGGEGSDDGVPDLLSASIAATEEQGVKPAPSDAQALADRLVAQVVAPYVEPRPDPRQADLIDAVDRATAGLLRAILHDPNFRSVEAAWRGLELLTRRLETGPDLKVFLVDVTRAELAADLAAAADPRDSGLYRLLAEPTVDTPGGVPWAVWIGEFSVGPTAEDAAFLERLGQVAGRAGAPLIARGEPGLVGAAGFAGTPDPDDWREPRETSALQAWEALRGTPASGYLALALPGWLARLPYGRDSDPVEGFAFEELEGAGDAEGLLWGNPAWLAGLALGEAFLREGWRLRPDRAADIDSLPFYVYKADGESQAMPCAEILLAERGGSRLADRGLTPVWSVKNADRVRVGPLRSLSEASPRLSGRWTG